MEYVSSGSQKLHSVTLDHMTASDAQSLFAICKYSKNTQALCVNTENSPLNDKFLQIQVIRISPVVIINVKSRCNLLLVKLKNCLVLTKQRFTCCDLMFPQGEKGNRGWRGLYGDIGTPGRIKVHRHSNC